MPRFTAGDCTFEPLGERMLLQRLGESVSGETSARVHVLAAALRRAALPGTGEVVPGFASLALHYDPAAWAGPPAPWRRCAEAAAAALAHAPAGADAQGACIEVPVHYGGADGPDLAFVARHAGLSAQEVVRRHARATYQVALLGFAPGFPYLLGLDPSLATPRRTTPRLRVPAGSVAIGGAQAGIYPAELPGGWHLIGRTPLRLFDPAREPPCLLGVGDRVRFVPIEDPSGAGRAAP
jgi:KipI family sensor histidine kinase inhibitor